MKYELNEWYWHEFMHTSSNLLEMITTLLAEHPVGLQDERARLYVEKATKAMYDLYQYAGERRFDSEKQEA